MKSMKNFLILSAWLSAMGLAGCGDGGGSSAASNQPVQNGSGAAEGAGVQASAGTYGPPGTTYVSETDRKFLEELKSAGVNNEQTEVDLHAINVGTEALSLNALKSVELCSESVCQQVSLSGAANQTVTATTDGTALALGKATLNADTFTHLKVRVVDEAGKDVEQRLKLREPLQARLLAKKMQALLAFEHLAGCKGENCLKTVSAAAAPGYEGAEYVYYSPVTGSARKVGGQVGVNMPAGMLQDAEIFVVAVTDTGGAHPEVEILPRLNLYSSMKVAIEPYADAKNRFKYFGETEKSLKSQQPRVHEVANPVDILAGGRAQAAEKSGLSEKNVKECVSKLKSDEVQAEMRRLDASGGWFFRKGLCQWISPYVDIAVTQKRLHDVVFENYRPSDGTVMLKDVREYSGFDVLINGFLWDGDAGKRFEGPDGTGKNLRGRPHGYVKGTDITNNRRHLIGKNKTIHNQRDGKKRVFAFRTPDESPPAFMTREATGLTWRSYSLVMSSSTSIIKNGDCVAGDSEVTRWSAVGFAPNGRAVYVSGATDYTTTTKPLCEVFKALGVNQAIRMDGGPSASMSVNGKHVNPLPLRYWAHYGNSRPVAWAFGTRRP